MYKYDTVILDLDGTLLDTLEDLKDSVNYALRCNDMPERTLEEVRQFVGNGLRNLMRRAIPDGLDNPKFEKTFQEQKEYYGEHCRVKTRPYDGIMELLQRLKEEGFALAIVSNKIDSAVKELNTYYFQDLIPVAIGERADVKRKPAPDCVMQALKELGKDGGHAVYIGDSEVDIQTAANSGLDCISVTWGFRGADFLKENGGKVFAADPKELETILLQS